MVKKFLDHTTPSAPTKEVAAFFLMVQPPLIVFKDEVRSLLMIVVGPVVNVEKPSRLFQAAVGIRIKKKLPKATDCFCGFP